MSIDPSCAEFLPEVEAPRAAVERRRTQRVPLQADVVLQDDKGRVVSGISTDVSETGVFVASYATVAVGVHVSVRFRLPTGHVMATGAIRWTREGAPGRIPGIGIELIEVSDEDHDTLRRFCAQSPRWLSYREIALLRR
jgi:uncharacterized protein (TIGR02266 family)